MRVEDFDFDLPAELIAQAPVYPREAAKLLHVSANGRRDETFGSIASVLRPGDLLVFNRAALFRHACLVSDIAASGGTGRNHPTEQLAPDTWTTFSKPGKRLAVGDHRLWPRANSEILSKDGPEVTVQFNQSGDALVTALEAVGSMPLPPYIKRDRGGDKADLADYQPFTAKDPGSVAARQLVFISMRQLLRHCDQTLASPRLR